VADPVVTADPVVVDPAPPAPDWRAGLTGDYAALAADPSLATFKGKDWAEVGPTLARAFVDTKKLVGTKGVKIPAEGSTAEEISAYRKATGVPDTPTGYQITRPDVAAGGDWDETAEAAFLGKMHEMGVPQKAVQAIIAWYGGYMADQQNGWRREADAAQQELRRDWGPNFDANLGRANRALQQYGGDALVDLLARTGLGRNPLIVQTFAKIGNDLVEHGAMVADPVGRVSPEEAKAKATELQADLLKVPQGSPQARALIDQIVALTKIATRGT